MQTEKGIEKERQNCPKEAHLLKVWNFNFSTVNLQTDKDNNKFS